MEYIFLAIAVGVLIAAIMYVVLSFRRKDSAPVEDRIEPTYEYTKTTFVGELSTGAQEIEEIKAELKEAGFDVETGEFVPTKEPKPTRKPRNPRTPKTKTASTSVETTRPRKTRKTSAPKNDDDITATTVIASAITDTAPSSTDTSSYSSSDSDGGGGL